MSAAQDAPDDYTTRAWMLHAACRNTVDPDLFFPDGWGGRDRRIALRYCRNCPVRTQCGDYADRIGVEHGIWGGRSYRPRTAKRRAA